MTFKVGQKVVCINDAAPADDCSAFMPCRPRKGETYTVRGIHTDPNLAGYGIYLDELQNPPVIWSDGHEVEWSFTSTRFRPLDDENNADNLVMTTLLEGEWKGMRNLRIEERELLRHTLGLDRSAQSYRNYFCAEPGHSDMPVIESLIELGLMRASHTINEGRDTIYVVTEAGKQAWH